MIDKVLNTPLFFSVLQIKILMSLKLNTFIPAPMIFYFVKTHSIVKESIRKCAESQIFKKYKQNLFL